MTQPSINKPGGFLSLKSETALSLAMLFVLVIMLVPLPQWLLDVLLAGNLGITTLLLLVTLSARRALDLTVFPSLLLLLTLYRVAMNIATTRLILLEGDAGHIVTAFGNYVVGGNLVVGLVVFLILVVVQFMVVTKGAGRISEVSARFTLDAMPGKQMAIDGELNAGSIDDKEARRRREELSRETEFYGAMDGASKFVRGDAVAGLIVTGVNLVGGVIVGISRGMSFGESIKTYSILTVGDGLVSQIPALIIATTAGLLVTKTSSDDSLGDEIKTQMLASERPVWVGATLLVVISLMPGLPKLPFLGVAGAMYLGVLSSRKKLTAQDEDPSDHHPGQPTPPGGGGGISNNVAGEEPDDDRYLDEFLLTERAVVEVGSRLVPYIQSKRVKGLSERITALRREFSKLNGLWVPPMRVHSNLSLNPEEYRILIAGRKVAGAELRTDLMLAILPDSKAVNVSGEATTEPAFGLDARWIADENRRTAEMQGCTVVDPLSVLITHLGEILKRYGHELLTREALKQILDRAREFAPTIVDEIKPETIRMGTLHQVLVQLAEDRIPLSDIALILESIINHAPSCKTPEELTDFVRVDLGRLVCERFRGVDGRLRVIAIDPRLDTRMRQSVNQDQLALGAVPLTRLIEAVGKAWKDSERRQQPLALLVDQSLRRPVRRLLARTTPDLGIVAYQEIPSDIVIDSVVILQHDDIVGPNATNEPTQGRVNTGEISPTKREAA
ncbi:MAG: FHIPEP family type III secretion protein [Planctomycetaceae bacterium]|nr:FHIPEP family type III secretion protein [Planctomycetaceae bacterium]